MAFQAFENQMKARWLDAVASEDLSEVTDTEWGDGTDLTPQLTADGISFNFNNNTVSVDLLDAGKIAQRPGTRGVGATLQAVRDDTTDTFWDTFEYGDEGYLVVAPFGEPAADDELYVLQGACQEPQPQQSAANTYQQAVVEFLAEDWNFKATMTSGT